MKTGFVVFGGVVEAFDYPNIPLLLVPILVNEFTLTRAMNAMIPPFNCKAFVN